MEQAGSGVQHAAAGREATRGGRWRRAGARLSIPLRLYALLGAVIAALCMVGAVNLVHMQRVHALTDVANRNTVPSLRALNQVLLAFMKLRIRTYRRIVNVEPGEAQAAEASIEEARREVQEALRAYEPYVVADEDARFFAEVREKIQRYLERHAVIAALEHEGRFVEAGQGLRSTVALALDVQHAIEAHSEYNAGVGRAASADALDVIVRATALSIGFSVLSIAVIGGLVFQIRGSLRARQIAAIVSTSDDAIVSKDLDGTITSWNAGAERIFGYRADEVIGRSVLMLIPPERRHEEPVIMDSIRRGQRVQPFETVRLHKDGHRIPMSITVSPVLDAAGAIVGASKIARDITQAKQAEEALREAKRQAELANLAKSDFLANMSHEIRTPMNAIIGMTQIVLDGPLSPQQEASLRKVSASSKALLRILNDILDYSKIEAGRLEIERIPLDVAEVLQQSLDLFGAEIDARALSVEWAIAPEVPATVLGDPLRLSQVLNNLLGNAVKFTERGGVRLEVTRESADEAEVVLRFAVRDSGIGLSREQAAQLFQPFVQADSSVTRKYGGTGLGLAICQNLVALMGGEISVRSEQGRGATFAFTVRFGRAAQRAPEPGETERFERSGRREPGRAAPEARPLAGLQILLAEDHPINQEIAKVFVERLGAVVTLASDGAQAVVLAGRGRWDAILMDLHMPVLDGLSATRRIRARLGEDCPPIIALSAAVFEADRQRCREAGMAGFVAKPIVPEELAACLDDLVRARRRVARRPGTVAEEDLAFDLPALVQRLGGDAGLAQRLLGRFVEEAEGFERRLWRALADGRLSEAAAALHTLRRLEAELARGQRPDGTAIDQWLRQLTQRRDELGRLLAAAAAGRADGPAEDDGGGDAAQAAADGLRRHRGRLERLRPYLEAGEVVPEELLAALLAHRRAHPGDAGLAAMLDRLDEFDHAGALARLDETLAALPAEAAEAERTLP
ncbi:PAS domain S-box protein [Piscinibacter sakaiensis]|uniref:hybrid sensor histidine kinase/response regulator n=1 Tax=Piscinibacter sakaiensis TaxID=1547922 RepID=UPI00372A3B2D